MAKDWTYEHPKDVPLGTRVREVETGRTGVVIMRPPPKYVRVRFDDDEPGGTGHPLNLDEIEPE